MKPIIEAVDKKLLKSELTPEKFIRNTNNTGNELYVFTAQETPNLMKEIARIRELTFREAGGGTGHSMDIDYYDTSSYKPYKQLIVWDPQEEEILGGYRYIACQEAFNPKENKFDIATARLYDFSQNFKSNYLPYAIELGRSFVQPVYQSTKKGRKALYALDNLWDGLGYLIVSNPHIKYFFGKVTMYNNYNRNARNILLAFMYHFFPDKQKLVTPKQSQFDLSPYKDILSHFNSADYESNFKILQTLLKEHNETVPPLINSYMKISPSMLTLGTCANESFGDVEETAILITIDDIYPKKKERHLNF